MRFAGGIVTTGYDWSATETAPPAEIATIDEMRFGNVAARGLDTVIAPNLGETSVIGMNLLSRLKSWRVEDNTLILVPNNPQEPVEPAEQAW